MLRFVLWSYAAVVVATLLASSVVCAQDWAT
jgi:hypothetical protein